MPTPNERALHTIPAVETTRQAFIAEGYPCQVAAHQAVRLRDLLDSLSDADWWAYSFHPADNVISEAIWERIMQLRAKQE